MSNVKTCSHIKVSGVRCGSPALRQQQFCYFHQRMHRGVRTPPRARLHPIALIEDEESIQMALMEVINGLMRNTLDLKRATLILRALHIAVKNANRVRFEARKSEMIREIPDYDDTKPDYNEDGIRDLEIPFQAAYGADPRASKAYRTYKSAEQAAKERDETLAYYYGYPNVEAYRAAKIEKETEKENGASAPSPKTSDTPKPAPARLGADAPVRPSGPQVRCEAAQKQPTTPPRKPAMGVRSTPPFNGERTRREGNGGHNSQRGA
jgi:hypothetical protein